MDFQSLTRRELQTLCKKNKIPANMTNVAMADALKALQNVDGLEEFLNPSESQNPQSPEKPEIGSPEVPRTVCRTSTRRRPIKAAEEPESSQTLTRTRCGTRRIKEEVNQEKSEVPQTPAVPSSRKRAPAGSARPKTVSRAEQSSVQRVYSTRRSARLSEKLSRTEPMEVEFSKVMTKDLDGDEEENKGADLQTISEDNSMITDDSEVVSDKKSVLSENDSKAEVEENTGESAKPDNSDFLEVSEEEDEAHDEQENTEAELQKNSEVDCEKMDESDKLLSEILKTSVHLNDESIVEKVDQSTGTDVSSVIMSNTENLNEGSKLEDEQQPRESDQELDLSASPQALVDDSSCDSETPELSLSAFADDVVCQNPVSMDSEMNVGGKGEHDDDGKAADQRDSEEFNMDLNQKAGDVFSRESGSDCSSVVDQSEALVEVEFAKQGSMDFEDVSPPPPSTDNDPMPETGEPNSEACVNVNEINNSVETLLNGDEMPVVFHELITAEENAMAVGEFPSLLDILPTPVRLMSSHRPVSNTAVSGRTLLSKDSEMNVASEGEPDNDDDDGKAVDQGDSEEFDVNLNQKAADASSSESGSDCSVVVHQSEAQVEPKFAKQASMDFEDVSPPSSGYDSMPETGEPNSEVRVNVDETNNSVEPLPEGDEMSVVSHEPITAEEHATAVYKFPSLLDNFSTPVKLMSPHCPISNTAVSCRTPLSPLTASPLLGQAPLPTLSTPTRKSSSKKPSAIQKMTLLSDNKENLDNSGRKMVLKMETGKKQNSRDTAEDIMLKKLSDTSLRQLRKMFKEKLQIKENTNKNNEDMNGDVKEVAKMRPALQTLPENHIAEVKTGKEN